MLVLSLFAGYCQLSPSRPPTGEDEINDIRLLSVFIFCITDNYKASGHTVSSIYLAYI